LSLACPCLLLLYAYLEHSIDAREHCNFTPPLNKVTDKHKAYKLHDGNGPFSVELCIGWNEERDLLEAATVESVLVFNGKGKVLALN
jgi:hypothetical protein